MALLLSLNLHISSRQKSFLTYSRDFMPFKRDIRLAKGNHMRYHNTWNFMTCTLPMVHLKCNNLHLIWTHRDKQMGETFRSQIDRERQLTLSVGRGSNSRRNLAPRAFLPQNQRSWDKVVRDLSCRSPMINQQSKLFDVEKKYERGIDKFLLKLLLSFCLLGKWVCL